MADEIRTSREYARYGTASHGEEKFTQGVPGQMKWSEFNTPGTPWDQTLGGRFAKALRDLEAIIYVLWGSIPANYSQGKVQWYDRVNPRCKWGPEIWAPKCIGGDGEQCSYVTPSGIVGCSGQCYDYHYNGDVGACDPKNYAACGGHPPQINYPMPQVPIRSQSEDPQKQYLTSEHHEYFPIGSVARSHSTQTGHFDPEGSGWFGATKPGRAKGSDSWLTVANGYTQKLGDNVTIEYTKPSSVPTPTSIVVKYRFTYPNGSTSALLTNTMNLSAGKYTTTISAQQHNTRVDWYILFNGTILEPLSGTYSFVFYTHYNPWPNGFPELITNYMGKDIRHGTDYYAFDGDETIQPALINMARFIISWLCGTTCFRPEEGCLNRGSALYHSPHLKDEDNCCALMPIRFYWSGSNVHPHYVRGGKDGVQPLYWPHEPAGLLSARRSWRGKANLFGAWPHTNPFYGGGNSWDTYPAELRLFLHSEWFQDAYIYSNHLKAGLLNTDVIDAVHLEEIIEAVNYLKQYGLWVVENTCKRRMSFTSFKGMTCGHTNSYIAFTPGFSETITDIDWTQKCCLESSGQEHQSSIPGQSYVIGPTYCTPHPTPTWADCWNNCLQDYCGITGIKQYGCSWAPESTSTSHAVTMNCSSGGGCGTAFRARTCDWLNGNMYDRLSGVTLASWAAYVCTPPRCRPSGFDSEHGNVFNLERYNHVWAGGLSPVFTGQPSGNCYDEIVLCGRDDEGNVLEAEFQSVKRVVYNSPAFAWWNFATPCGPSSNCWDGWNDAPAPIPGLGLYNPNGDPMCSFAWHRPTSGPPLEDIQSCQCSNEGCMDGAWVSIDMNIDIGTGMPTLKPYSLTQDPAFFYHNCPCETLTGTGKCES